MKTAPPAVWEVSVATVPAGEEAVSELLGQSLGRAPVCTTNLITNRSRVAVYCEAKNLPAPDTLESVRSQLRALRLDGVRVASLRVERVRHEDWAESWKKHFPPLEIGRELLLRPSWSRRKPRAGQAVLTLDPGLSFGTGQHATTAFCLKQLVTFRDHQAPQSCLDVGTGSGILALAAARLGYAPVRAFDFDPIAVAIARGNAATNGLQEAVQITRADATRLPTKPRRRYTLVCANLLADLLVNASDRLLAHVAPTGRLVVAGILRSEFAAVRQAYERSGMRLIASRAEKEWRSGAFAWK